MRLQLVSLAVLALSAALPTAAFADRDHDDGRDGRGQASIRADGFSLDVAFGDFFRRGGGHYETRETRRVTPAVVRQEWIPDRYEEVCIPAVTETVCVPAVIDRVYVPAVYERREVAERVERQFVPGHYEAGQNVRGAAYRVWIDGHYEVRTISPARCEDVLVRPAHFEDRVIRSAHDEIRVVQPERRERRLVESGRFCTVVVCPERTEIVRERVWVEERCDDRSAFGRR